MDTGTYDFREKPVVEFTVRLWQEMHKCRNIESVGILYLQNKVSFARPSKRNLAPKVLLFGLAKKDLKEYTRHTPNSCDIDGKGISPFPCL